MLSPAMREAERIQGEAQALIARAARKYSIFYKKLTPIIYVRIVDFGVELTLRYLTDARRRRSTEDELSREILDSFAAEPRVAFAYPTYRLVSKSGIAEGELASGSEPERTQAPPDQE